MMVLLGKLIWVFGLVSSQVIRWPHLKRNRATRVVDSRVDLQEKLLLGMVYIGMMILPMLYSLTSLLSFADYPMQPWALGVGSVMTALGLWLFYRSHAELGRNWSQSLDVREEHRIIDTGVYGAIRHPMYSAMLLCSLAQLTLLPNYVAGPAGFLCMVILCILRIPREEGMMQEHFGDAYRRYMQNTKRLIPGLL